MGPDLRSRAGTVAVLLGATALAACGTKPYVPLTAANLASTMKAAAANLHTAREVSSGSGVTTTIDFDNAGVLKYRLSQAAAGAQAKTLIGVGGDRYLQEPGVTPAGKWLKLAGSSSAPVIAFAQLDPVAMVTRFNQGLVKLVYLGTTSIGGANVHQYRITIDQQKLFQSTGQSQGSANIGAGESITENLYLNGDNTLRRVSVMLPGGVGDTQIDVTGWGAPVSIQAPPPSSVVTSVRPGT